jgi:FhuF 2Fe-2S C-terminal domain
MPTAEFSEARARAADPGAVRAALRDAAGVGPFFVLSVGDGSGDWRPAVAMYSGGLRDVIASTARQLGVAEDRVAAATVHLGYAARLWSPVLYCALVHGIVPDLTDLRVGGSPSVRLNLPEPRGWQPAGHDGPAAVDGLAVQENPAAREEQASLAGLAYRMVMSQHLEPMAAGLSVKIAAGLLRGNAASAMTAALRMLVSTRPALAPAARAMAQTLLATGSLRGTGELTGPGLEFMRRSCCLFYRVPNGGTCGDCPLPGTMPRRGSAAPAARTNPAR